MLGIEQSTRGCLHKLIQVTSIELVHIFGGVCSCYQINKSVNLSNVNACCKIIIVQTVHQVFSYNNSETIEIGRIQTFPIRFVIISPSVMTAFRQLIEKISTNRPSLPYITKKTKSLRCHSILNRRMTNDKSTSNLLQEKCFSSFVC